jgi:superoxide reductase
MILEGEKMKLLKCNSCGALVKVIDECNCSDCGIMCCKNKMMEVSLNSKDASFEKHLPQYEIVGDKIKVVVPHVMEEEHYITFITYVHDNKEETIYLNSKDEPKVEFTYYPNSKLYSYCNKHGLWVTEVI